MPKTFKILCSGCYIFYICFDLISKYCIYSYVIQIKRFYCLKGLEIVQVKQYRFSISSERLLHSFLQACLNQLKTVKNMKENSHTTQPDTTLKLIEFRS